MPGCTYAPLPLCKTTACTLCKLQSVHLERYGSETAGIPAEHDAQSEVVVQLESLLSTQGFFKRVLSSKSTHVRTAAYTLMAHLCYRYMIYICLYMCLAQHIFMYTSQCLHVYVSCICRVYVQCVLCTPCVLCTHVFVCLQ